MKATNRTDVFRHCICAIMVVGGISMLLGYAMAGPIVQSTTEETRRTTQDPAAAFPVFPWTSEPSSTEDKKETRTGSSSTTTAPPSQTQSSTGSQPAPSYVQPSPQNLPLPPTYAPGSPSGSSVDPYGEMPMPPTAYGLYDSPTPEATAPSPGMRPRMSSGMGGGAATGGGYTGYGSQPRGGYAGLGNTGYGAPPAPTPTSSLGGVALMDPSFGRYESQDIREATAPRQPASIGRSQSQILRGSKPFSAYRPASAYSPYMRLSRDLTSGGNSATNTYYEWVKPLLEQQQENRRVTHNIQGLTDTARAGYQSLESMKQRPGNTIRNVAPRNPATFMNTGQYYPGFSR